MSIYNNKKQQLSNSKKSSQIYVWGDNKFGQLGIKELQNTNIQQHSTPKVCQFHIIVEKISCGKEHSALVTIEGYLYMMGNNQNGQLGISQRHILFFQQPQLVETLQRFKINDVSCGGCHTVAVTNEGELFSWGDNQYGQLGLNSFEEFYTPQIVKLSFEGDQIDFQVQKVSSGMFHTLILMYDNTVYSFGNGEFGQLGLGDNASTNLPCYIDFLSDKIIDIAAGYQHSLFLSHTGKVFSTGFNKQGYNIMIKNNRQLGQGHLQDIAIPKEIYLQENVTFKIISASSYSACVSLQGELYFFGNCPFGQFNIPKKNGGQNIRFTNISIGFHFGMAIDDESQVYGWGINNAGQLLQNQYDQNSQFSKLQKMNGTKIQQISCGFNFVISVGDLQNEQIKNSNISRQEIYNKNNDFQIEQFKELTQEEIDRRRKLYNQIENSKEISAEEIERRRKQNNIKDNTKELTSEEIERRRKQHNQIDTSKEITPEEIEQRRKQFNQIDTSKELTPEEIERRRSQYKNQGNQNIFIQSQSPKQKQPNFQYGGVNVIKTPLSNKHMIVQDYFKNSPKENVQSQIKQVPIQDQIDLKKENIKIFQASKIKMPKTQETWEKIVESKDQQINQLQQQNEQEQQRYQQYIEELIRSFEQDYQSIEQILTQKDEDLEKQTTKILSLENQLSSINDNNKELLQSNESTLADHESQKKDFLEREQKYQQIIDSLNSKLAEQQKQMEELNHTLEKLQNTDMSVLSVE